MRPLLGFVAGLATLAVVAYPAFWTAWFALASFTGCFLSCSEPDPAIGVMWGAVTLLLLALPIVVGVSAGRRQAPKMRAPGGSRTESR